MLSTRRRAQKPRTRTRTDLAVTNTSTRRRGRSTLFRASVPQHSSLVTSNDQPSHHTRHRQQTLDALPTFRPYPSTRTRTTVDSTAHGTRFFNEHTENSWILRGRRYDRRVVQAAVQGAVRAAEIEDSSTKLSQSSQSREERLDDAPRSVSSEVSALLQPRRRAGRAPSAPLDSRYNRDYRHPYHSRRGPTSLRDRRVQFSRARRRDGPMSDDVAQNPNGPSTADSERHSWYDLDADHRWRLPIGKPLRRADLLGSLPDKFPDKEGMTRWSSGTASDSGPKPARASPFHGDRSDNRRAYPNARRDDASYGRPRDRSGKRIGISGARWRALLARKDLVDGKADVFCCETNDRDLSPRSSLDIEEATSLFSWDEPPSTSIRGWRSNQALSYRPPPDRRPRHIIDIGRQRCINDLTEIVDASNEPCVSYDRQIFDPASKLWTYVEACQPSSSPWEMRAVGSPVTCSVSGTEEALSSMGRAAPASASASASLDVTQASTAPALVPAEPTKRRNSSPGFAAITNAMEAKHAFKVSRDLWLGTTRKSVYGPANLEEVIFASELDDAEENMLRRASMA